MKKIFRKILIFTGIVLIVLFLITVLIIVPYYERLGKNYKSIRENSSKFFYYYSSSDGMDIRDGIYIFDLSDSDSLINYYSALNDSFEPLANFKGGLIKRNNPLYIVEYIGKDSLISKVIDSNNYENYVFTPLLHKMKPRN